MNKPFNILFLSNMMAEKGVWTLLEAMQQHKACIASNEGGISGIIEDGKTGYVVEKKNVAQLADRMVNLMQHPELCISMGQAGYEKYQREFTLQCFERRMVEVLSECVVGKGYF